MADAINSADERSCKDTNLCDIDPWTLVGLKVHAERALAEVMLGKNDEASTSLVTFLTAISSTLNDARHRWHF